MTIDQTYDPAVPIDALTPHPLNPRQGDVGAIHQSIQANGFYGAVIVQKGTGYIIAGNHRWRAAQAAGMKTIPAHVIDVDDDRARRILLADNRTNDLASYDDTALLEILRSLAETTDGLIGTGYDGDDLDDLIDDLDAEKRPGAGGGDEAGVRYSEAADELRDKWKTDVGQVWLLGPHRLVIADATDPGAYQALGSPTVDMVWTDPPYGITYQSSGRDPERQNTARKGRYAGVQHRVIENDDMTHEQLDTFLRAALGHAHKATKPGGAWYVTSPSGHTLGVFANVLTDLKVWRHTIVWVKDQLVFGRSDYHYQHETVCYGWKDGAAHFFTDDRTQTSVWNIDRPTKSEHHPTMKPIELISRAIRNSTRPGETVLDPFTGSGTTLVAAHQKDRIGLGIELHPSYAAVTIQRLADEGVTPELAS